MEVLLYNFKKLEDLTASIRSTTALAYDATRALIFALEKDENPTRTTVVQSPIR
ncbi:MAG: hypothetical protein AB4372_26350 [Xenococcus sp. (in: cyanobacteria)]